MLALCVQWYYNAYYHANTINFTKYYAKIPVSIYCAKRCGIFATVASRKLKISSSPIGPVISCHD
jgi:hypothetical protein